MFSVFQKLARLLHDRRAARAWARRGHQFYQQEEFDAAVDAYEQSLRLQPGSLPIRFNLGLALYKAGRKLEARVEWQSVLEVAEHTNVYLAEQVRIMLRQFG